MPTFGDLSKYKQKSNAYTVPSYVAQQKYSLTDLRKDEEFNKVTERFLTSLGEGETVGDLFGYFRGADYNLGDATKMVFESGKFTQQQKTDYQYLRNKFDNADVGGFGEWVRAGANVTKEIITDPTMIASALFVPWSGGTSVVSRIAAGKAVQTTLKKLANKEIAEGVSKGVAKLPGQTLKAPMSKNAKTVAASTEGFIYGSTANFTKQHADVNTDRREEVSPEESLAMGAITAAIPAVFRGAGAGYTKFNKSIADRRAARIDGNEDYKVGIIDKGIEKTDAIIEYVTPNIRILTGFVNKPTSILLEKMEASPTLDKIVKYFRYDAAKSITAKDYDVSQKVSSRSFYEDVNSLIGFRSEQLKAIIDPLKTKGTVTVPKLGSRDSFFKIPFKDAPKAEKQSYFKRQRIADNVNDALAYYLRTGRKTVTVDGKQIKLEQAFKLTDKSTDDIITAGQGIKKLMSDIRNDAKREGLEIGLIKNYLPRGFSYGDVKAEIKNLEKGIEGKLVKELKTKEGLKTNEDVIDLLQDIINPSKTAGKSYTELATVGKGEARKGLFFPKTTPGLTKERTLKNIDENNIVDYLDNNVENLLYDYIHQSSSFIQRKAGLGEDLDEFIKRFVNPIKEELAAKGKKLTEKEYKRLEDIYLVTTGQVQQVDNVIGRTLSDIAVVGNQLALLPLATITSLSEVAVPLVRGAGKKSFQKGKTESGVDKGGVRILWETAGDYRKMWWNDLVKKDIADARPESLKELNRFNRAMNRAGEDRSLAMYGQGFGRRATQAQNKFFKINLLHDWTRFVQLTSFNVGKAKMYENLHELTTNKSISAKTKIRLTNELKELGVDVTAGKRWVQSGGKASGKFYDENFLPSAARYVDEVIMNPTAAANQKPLWHSMPSTRWAFGLMGFPTAFSNTVLKNAVREVAIDARSRESFKGTSQAISGVTVMTAIAMFGNTLRSKGRNLEELESGEKDIGEEILDAAIRTGLLGPGEQVYRTVEDKEYTNLIRAITQRFTGPAVNDVIKFFDSWVGPLSIGVDKIPGIALLRTTNPETYKEIKSLAKEADKVAGFTAQRKTKEEEKETPVPLYSTGGRVNKFTGGSLTDEYKYYSQLSEEVEKLPEKAKEFIEEREERRTEAHKQIVKATKEGDVRKGFEAFETLPIGEQLAGYMNPVTNAPLSATGALIYAEKAKPSVKTLKEFAIDFINPTKNILQKTPIKVEDPMSAGISAMEAFGVVPFIGGVGKFGSKTLRKIQARRGDDTMGGGNVPTNIVDDSVAVDMAGYKSSIEEFAEKNINNYKSGQAFLDALKSSKRQQDKFKKEELEFIDLDNIQVTKDTKPEEVLNYIKENRPKLYRVVRSEDNPTIRTSDVDMNTSVEDILAIDEPMTREYLNEEIEHAARMEMDMRDAGNEAYRNVSDDDIYEAVTEQLEDESYEYLTGNISGTDIALFGNDVEGYQATVGMGDNRIFLTDDFVARDEALIQLDNYARERDLIEPVSNIDPDVPLKTQVSESVLKGEDTLPTMFGEQYGSFRLPMGGASNYREITIHLDNPRTTTAFTENHLEGADQLLHYRISDRVDTEGKKVLFVEEIQSDLHQAGRAGGYELPLKKQKLIEDKVNSISPRIMFDKGYKDSAKYNKVPDEIEFDKDMPTIAGISSGSNPSALTPKQVVASGDVIRGKFGNYYETGDVVNFSPLEKTTKFLEDEYGKETILKLADALEPFRNVGKLPDYPYKGLEFVDVAMKDVMQLASKEGYDKVAFTDAATQIARNNKDLNYVDSIQISKVPTEKEILQSDEFTDKLNQNLNTRYDDFKNFGDPDILKGEGLKGNEVYEKAKESIDEYKKLRIGLSRNGEFTSESIEDEIKTSTLSQLKSKYNVGRAKWIVKDFGLTGVVNTQKDTGKALMYESKDYLKNLTMDKDGIGMGETFNTRTLQTDEELLAELPESIKESVKQDIKTKKDIRVDVGKLEGSGKKFLDLYSDKVSSTAKKLGKQYKQQPKFSSILYSKNEKLTPEQMLEMYIDRKEAKNYGEYIQKYGEENSIPKELKVISLDVTPDMKKPMAVFAKGGIVEGKDDVPFTKENPANRVDPFTGQPYSLQMEELGLNVFQEK